MSINKLLLLYFAAVSIFTIIVTAADKINAIHSRRRVPESFLLTLGLIGGAFSEYITMKIIRHKTRKKRFMLGLPAIFIIQAALFCLLYFAKHSPIY